MLKLLVASIGKRLGFRERRVSLFMEAVRPTSEEMILDLGCGDGAYFVLSFPHKAKVIGVDVKWERLRDMRRRFPQTRAVVADGRKLPFKDKGVDIIFSNSTIEHLGDFEAQKLFAQEIMRVGGRCFIQTPNRYFPIEPHTFVPLFQFLPRGLQRFLSLRLPLGHYARGGVLRDAVSLLSGKDLLRLFPGSKIYRERFLGLTKSFCVYSNGSEKQEIIDWKD
ncbi:MAG: class I SAM-dependent methyltransferase [candidate division NC10 bacterium]